MPRIIDDRRDGDPCFPGDMGQLMRGQLMRDYWQNDDKTAKLATRDGFFETGDIGIMDTDGYTTIVDRAKVTILGSGFDVHDDTMKTIVA